MGGPLTGRFVDIEIGGLFNLERAFWLFWPNNLNIKCMFTFTVSKYYMEYVAQLMRSVIVTRFISHGSHGDLEDQNC